MGTLLEEELLRRRPRLPQPDIAGQRVETRSPWATDFDRRFRGEMPGVGPRRTGNYLDFYGGPVPARAAETRAGWWSPSLTFALARLGQAISPEGTIGRGLGAFAGELAQNRAYGEMERRLAAGQEVDASITGALTPEMRRQAAISDYYTQQQRERERDAKHRRAREAWLDERMVRQDITEAAETAEQRRRRAEQDARQIAQDAFAAQRWDDQQRRQAEQDAIAAEDRIAEQRRQDEQDAIAAQERDEPTVYIYDATLEDGSKVIRGIDRQTGQVLYERPAMPPQITTPQMATPESQLRMLDRAYLQFAPTEQHGKMTPFDVAGFSSRVQLLIDSRLVDPDMAIRYRDIVLAKYATPTPTATPTPEKQTSTWDFLMGRRPTPTHNYGAVPIVVPSPTPTPTMSPSPSPSPTPTPTPNISSRSLIGYTSDGKRIYQDAYGNRFVE
ncbi:MAG TPA: hypothetical protein VLH56_08575 [Dissulfurispiraceae bacterium]|nr:hypothetical protein [Dissulfurispiraceae bacterium]